MLFTDSESFSEIWTKFESILETSKLFSFRYCENSLKLNLSLALEKYILGE